VSLPVIFGLTDRLGSASVAFGRIVLFVVPFIAIFDLEHRRLGGIQSSFWAGNLLRFGVAAISASVIETITIASLPSNWQVFLLATLLGFIFYTSVLWLLGIANEEDRHLMRRIIQREA
jgi:hypothetical protein